MKKKNSSDESKIEKISNSQPYLKKINEKARKSLASQDFNRVKKCCINYLPIAFCFDLICFEKKYAHPPIILPITIYDLPLPHTLPPAHTIYDLLYYPTMN